MYVWFSKTSIPPWGWLSELTQIRAKQSIRCSNNNILTQISQTWNYLQDPERSSQISSEFPSFYTPQQRPAEVRHLSNISNGSDLLPALMTGKKLNKKLYRFLSPSNLKFFGSDNKDNIFVKHEILICFLPKFWVINVKPLH